MKACRRHFGLSGWLALSLVACTGPDLMLGDYGPGAAQASESDADVPESPRDSDTPPAADGGTAPQQPEPDPGQPDAGEEQDAAEPHLDEAPACTQHVHCQEDADEPLCDTRRNRCVECLVDTDCSDPEDLGCLEGRCVQCQSDADCADPATCQDGECEN